AVDHALGEIAALQRGDLRREEGEGTALRVVRIVEAEDVLLQAELDRRLARDLDPRRRAPAPGDDQRHENGERERPDEAPRDEPPVARDDGEVIAQVARPLLLSVQHRRAPPAGWG